MEHLTIKGRLYLACLLYAVEIMLLAGVILTIGLLGHPILGVIAILALGVHSLSKLPRLMDLSTAAKIEAIMRAPPPEEMLPTDAFHGIHIDPRLDAINSRN